MGLSVPYPRWTLDHPVLSCQASPRHLSQFGMSSPKLVYTNVLSQHRRSHGNVPDLDHAPLGDSHPITSCSITALPSSGGGKIKSPVKERGWGG